MLEVGQEVLIIVDYDTDEECRNPEIVNNKWNWFEQALFFTRSDAEAIIKLAQEKNLVAFRGYSCDTATKLSLRCMFVRQGGADDNRSGR